MLSRKIIRPLILAGAALLATAPAQAQFWLFEPATPDPRPEMRVKPAPQPGQKPPRSRNRQEASVELSDSALRSAAYDAMAPRPGDPNYAELPPDADPNYSTPVNLDGKVDTRRATQKVVADPTGEPAGTITISAAQRKLYLSNGDGTAVQYSVGVGKQGFSWKGEAVVGRKSFWPGWTPPPEMIERRPELPEHMDGSLSNPLGARALYLFQGKTDTLFRIHGTNEPNSIGHAVSSGCIRMHNADIIDLYTRVSKGARVVVN